MAAMMAPKTISLHPQFPVTTSFSSRTLHCKSVHRRATMMAIRMQTRIHRLIDEQGIVLMPGCYDSLSASISGYALSAALLGKPDFGLLTPPEMAETSRSVCAAAPLTPIIADADTGGGNSLNVQRTIKDLIAAGCFLRIKHGRRSAVIPAEEHAAKIQMMLLVILTFFLPQGLMHVLPQQNMVSQKPFLEQIFIWRFSNLCQTIPGDSSTGPSTKSRNVPE